MKINKLLTIALLINSTAIYAGLNDTGITTCSNETQNGLPCPVAGFPGQDAEYGTNSFDFTKLDANGNAMAVTATNHSCVKDNVTGLIWEVKTDDGGLRDKDNTYTFDQAATFATQVNATNLCGHNDWRVPSPLELTGIVDYGISNPGPTINTNYFPNTLGTVFWTNALSTNTTNHAWDVGFYDGHVYEAYPSSYIFNVRLVRGIPLSFNSFRDNGDGTVTEQNTYLMWAKCVEGLSGSDCALGNVSYLNWGDALNVARNSRLGGYSDWRLPNIKELQTLVKFDVTNPSIDKIYFPNTPVYGVWSSSSHAYDDYSTNHAWNIVFNIGYIYGEVRNFIDTVRLVRGGQLLLSFPLTINKLGAGLGTIVSTPAGINCGGSTGSPSDCSENYASGTRS